MGNTSSEEAPVSLPAVVNKQEPKKPNIEKDEIIRRSNSKKDEIIKRSNSKTVTEVVLAKGKEETLKPNVVKNSKEDAEKPQRVPHMYHAIIKHADNYQSTANGSLLDQIQSSGIFLNNKKQKYWVEEKTGHNCFMLFARSLQIVWSENNKYWQWSTLKLNRDEEIEIASLLNVCWLEVNGRFETSYLTPKVLYEVMFVVMMVIGYGWDKPVNLRLTLPNKNAQQHEESLLQAPKGQWIELKVGEFIAEEKLAGEMEFSLFESEGGEWKRGLIIKGAVIRPKK